MISGLPSLNQVVLRGKDTPEMILHRGQETVKAPPTCVALEHLQGAGSLKLWQVLVKTVWN